MEKINWNRVETPWNGWGWYDHLYLVDPDGNRYSPEMIKASLWAAELAHQLSGSPLQVFSLKAELRRRLATPPPEIVIHWQGQETRVLPPSWKIRF